MIPFTKVSGVGAVLMRDNIDTDQITPGHTLMKLQTSGFGADLFANWRYLSDGTANPGFVLNRPPFDSAVFLIAGHNFGCGSSREAAVWAVRDFGIRAIIAPSFGAIYLRNCYNNGVLPVVLPQSAIVALSAALGSGELEFSVDLEKQQVISPDETSFSFEVPETERARLLNGLDQIGATLLREHVISNYQERDRLRRPWVYAMPFIA